MTGRQLRTRLEWLGKDLRLMAAANLAGQQVDWLLRAGTVEAALREIDRLAEYELAHHVRMAGEGG